MSRERRGHIIDSEYVFRRAGAQEVPIIFGIVLARMKWMDEQGIRQWNVTGYDRVYPPAYYESKRQKGELFVLTDEQGDILCAAVLRGEDERWDGVRCDKDGVYLHNFASKIGASGAGADFLRRAEEYAAGQGKRWFRLDSADGNVALERYYTARGYQPVGACTDGPYRGILREKALF